MDPMAKPVVWIASNINGRIFGNASERRPMNNDTFKALSLKNRQRLSERGMTLIEIMIVVSIIAMVAAGVAVVAIPKMKEAQIKAGETGARTIRNAVSQWQLSENEYSECPNVSQLIQDKQLDSGQTTVDPWGEEYEISCADDEVVVASKGPDKKKGSKDDIVIPKGASAGDEEE
jgi:general secretion pathway protein G